MQARENSARKDLKDRQTSDDNATEIANNIYGDILTENPAVAQSAFGAHRVITDRWKGMTPEQIADIKRTQELQAKEKQVTPSTMVASILYGMVWYGKHIFDITEVTLH